MSTYSIMSLIKLLWPDDVRVDGRILFTKILIMKYRGATSRVCAGGYANKKHLHPKKTNKKVVY